MGAISAAAPMEFLYMELNKLSEKTGLRGRIVLRKHAAGSIARFQAMIAAGRPKEEILAAIRAGEVMSDRSNLIMQAANVGKDLLVQWLLGTATYPVGINYGAIGTGTNTPAITDVKLQTETNRTVVSFSQDSGFNEAILQFFFSDSTLTNQTYNEFGTFINGGAGANSGQIFNHALFTTPYAKVAGVDTTVEVDITLT